MPCQSGPSITWEYENKTKQTHYLNGRKQGRKDSDAPALRVERVIKREIKELKETLDEVTHDGCQMREIYLALTEQLGDTRTTEYKKVLKEQIKHRQVDVDRLIHTLKKEIKNAQTLQETLFNQDRLRRVEVANTKFPLEPQIGFDPDSI